MKYGVLIMRNIFFGVVIFLSTYCANATQVSTAGIADGAVTNAKITSVAMSKVTSGAGFYFSYKPNDVECADGETLSWVAATDRWVCAASGSGANTSLSNLVATAINQDLEPNADGTISLGSASFRFSEAHVNQISNSGSINIISSGGGINAQALGGPIIATVDDASSIEVRSATSTAAIPVRLYNPANTFYAGIKSPVLLANYTLTLPLDDGTSGQFLQTNGSGVLTWAAAGGGGANTALSNLAATAVNANILPDINSTRSLGSTSFRWAELWSDTVKSSGVLLFSGVGGLESQQLHQFDAGINLYYNAGGYGVRINAPALAGNYVLTMPLDDGNSGQVLSTNGSGVLSWVTAGGAFIYPNNTYLQAYTTGAVATNLLGLNNSNTLILQKGAGPLGLQLETTSAYLGNNSYIALDETAVTIDSYILNGLGTLMSGFEFTLRGNGTGTPILVLNDANDSARVSIKSPDVLSSSYTLTLPPDDGTSGQVLSTDGSGITSWIFAAILGNHVTTTGTSPAVSACGTSPSIVGNDTAGRVTVGTGGVATSCTITFNSAWTNAPICTVGDESTSLLLTGSASTTVLTITAATPFSASDLLVYHCIGYQ